MTPQQPVTGSVAYEVAGEPPADWCLRLDYQLGLADAVSWCMPGQILLPSGLLRFSFDRLADSVWPSVRGHRGPVALFLRACSCPASLDIRARRPLSNT